MLDDNEIALHNNNYKAQQLLELKDKEIEFALE